MPNVLSLQLTSLLKQFKESWKTASCDRPLSNIPLQAYGSLGTLTRGAWYSTVDIDEVGTNSMEAGMSEKKQPYAVSGASYSDSRYESTMSSIIGIRRTRTI